MPGSPRPPGPPPPEAAPALGPSQPMAAPSGGDEDDEEFEICNYDGFVFKRARGLYPDVAPSSIQATGPDPEAARRRALLRLRAKRLRELSRWEAIASNLLVPLPAPRQLPPQAPPASPRPAPAAAASASVLDDLIAQAEVQAELLKKVSQCCDEIQNLCDAQEAAVVDVIAALPVWGNPKDLINSLCNSPDEQTAPGDLDFREDMWQHKQNEESGGFQRSHSRQDRRAIEAGSYNGCKEAAVQRIKNNAEARKKGPYQCKRCSQFDHTEKTCRETPAELGDELPPPILAENRKMKVVASPSGSNSAAAQASNKEEEGIREHIYSLRHSINCKSRTVSPGRTARKAASTPRAPDTFCSPGPTTRRRAAAQNVP
ncbi:uncharacterized protein LOC133919211 [Phragmites australis]|uniref:uncharacterized protein LOC133919211 n=1 Tax=Phragmites australis TaxID=29695 RepID=UPI002D79FE18|nr:uncharacterized protein LOC133919211 [Phragmites australis]